VDLRRAGHLEPVSLDWLVELHTSYLSEGFRDRLGETDLAGALEWATASVRGASSCLLPVGPNRYLAFDYLVDYAELRPGAPDVPEPVWQRLLTTRALSADQMFRIARAAARFGRIAEASRLWSALAEGNDRFAMFNLGWAAQMRDDPATAEQWYARAAEAGNSWAMSNLGTLAERRGEVSLAAAGDPNGLRKEAVLELLHGDRKRGADLLRRVALAGDPAALRLMGLLSQTEDAAAPRSDVDALRRLAAEMGDSDAALDLARNLWNQGDLDAAEIWFRRAAETENGKVAEFGLAVLLEQRGRAEDAESWYRRSAEHGLPEAMLNLGTVLQERAEFEEAEHWYHRALGAGHLPAEVNLGALHWRRGNLAEGHSWYQRAADRGDELAKQALENFEAESPG
jgi:TPR repeat protein